MNSIIKAIIVNDSEIGSHGEVDVLEALTARKRSSYG
jgi:hypothetical protein